MYYAECIQDVGNFFNKGQLYKFKGIEKHPLYSNVSVLIAFDNFEAEHILAADEKGCWYNDPWFVEHFDIVVV